MTPLLYLSILLASTVSATTYRKNNHRDNFDSGETYSSFGNGYFGDDASPRTGPSKREYNGSPYDADDYIPPKIGIKHNNDYSALGDGYQEYAGAGGSGGSGAVSYSQVISEHRPVQRYNPSSQSSQYPSQSSTSFGSPSHYRGLTAEGTNVVEKPAVPGLFKVPIPVIPAFDRPILPLVPVAPVIAPVKYPIQFIRPFAYLAPEGKAFQQQGHHQQGFHQQGHHQQGHHQQAQQQQLAPVKHEQPEYLLTKVPLVYHATYSETPQSQAGFNHHNQKNVNFKDGSNNFNDGSNNFNHGSNNFNHGSNNFNHGLDFNLGPNENFNHGTANHKTNGFQSSVNHGHHNLANNQPQNHNFHHNQHLPAITTPGTPVFNNYNPPVPLVPTPTPYHHQNFQN